MRILYAAIDQVVPGTKGGSVHVAAVAEGLAALGHDVHVLTAAMKIDLLLFGRIESGPFFALLERTSPSGQAAVDR